MRVAVLSDIHSNFYAFKACYEDAVKSGADSFIFLGDYISDLAEPQKTMDLVYEIQNRYPTICLRGNREGYMLDCEDGVSSFVRGSKTGSLLFTYEHLRKKDLDFFRGLKISDIVELGSVQIEIAHAAMDDDRFYFDCKNSRIAEVFSKMKCNYLLTGHSHKQYIKQDSGKTIINPGSVGIPQDGTRNPKYALLDIVNGNVSCVFREVPYNMADTIHSQFSSGLVDYAKYWAIGVLYDIITAEERVLQLLKCVQQANGDYDEEVWHSCAIKLGMKFTEQEMLAVYRNTDMETRKKIITEHIGKRVHVVVDRPVGYRHGDLVYPINYGYIPGVIAGDGEEQDVYILGANEPLTEFDGQVVAAICRKNDCEDKLVVAPVGIVYHQGQIAEAVYFQEQYFDCKIISCLEKSCGVLPYRIVDGQKEFLLVFESFSKCWSLPKGHMEAGETQVQTALRELYEETGLTAKLDVSRVAVIEYPISDFARKQVVFYLGEVTGTPKVREGEIDKYKWVTEEGLKELLFPDTFCACKELLR